MQKEKLKKEKVALEKIQDSLESAIQMVSFFHKNPAHEIKSRIKTFKKFFLIFLSHELMDDVHEREKMLSFMLFLDELKSAAHKMTRDKVLDVNRLLLDQVEQTIFELEQYE
jgi:hypothetical protein